jgi:hypothetical protein
MTSYYVNDHAQSTGEHEVHAEGCYYLSLTQSKTYLGYFDNCREAVREARKKYTDVDGCAFCCPDCHSK